MDNLDALINGFVQFKKALIKSISSISLLNIDFEPMVEALKTLPTDVKETTLYHNVIKINETTCLDDIKWIFEEYNMDLGISNYDCYFPECSDDSSVVSYMKSIIKCDMGEREKLIVLLSHFETFLKECYPDIETRDIKKHYTDYVEMHTEMTAKNLHLLCVSAIVQIVYANTIKASGFDRNLPHRNDILHNGIIGYSNEEVHNSYICLLGFIYLIKLYFE